MALPMVGAPETATGGLSFAPLKTPLPTDASTPLNEAFIKAGFIGDSGLSLTRDISTDKVKAWGGGTARVLVSDTSETLKFTILESQRADILKAVYGDENVTDKSGKISVKHTTQPPAPLVFIGTMKDGAVRRRIVVPNGQLTVTGDVNYTHSDVIKYEASVECLPDENGVLAYEYIDGAAA